MQTPGDPGAPGASGAVDEDMADGDLGDGTRAKPEDNQSCTGLGSRGGGASEVRSEGAQWRAGVDWSRSQDLTRAGGLTDLSKEELMDRLQRATQTIQVLESELEAAHRYLQGKYAALKILQGQAMLEKATSHTKSLGQKSEERAKALEKEVNTLQWELSLSQLRLRTSEQAFEKNFYRMLSERNSLSEALKQKELEKEQLRAENLALSAQYVELLSRVGPHSLCPKAPPARGHPRATSAPAPPRSDAGSKAPPTCPQRLHPPDGRPETDRRLTGS